MVGVSGVGQGNSGYRRNCLGSQGCCEQKACARHERGYLDPSPKNQHPRRHHEPNNRGQPSPLPLKPGVLADQVAKFAPAWQPSREFPVETQLGSETTLACMLHEAWTMRLFTPVRLCELTRHQRLHVRHLKTWFRGSRWTRWKPSHGLARGLRIQPIPWPAASHNHLLNSSDCDHKNWTVSSSCTKRPHRRSASR